MATQEELYKASYDLLTALLDYFEKTEGVIPSDVQDEFTKVADLVGLKYENN